MKSKMKPKKRMMKGGTVKKMMKKGGVIKKMKTGGLTMGNTNKKMTVKSATEFLKGKGFVVLGAKKKK
tara:strand:- start:26 stop:229 length:204 start_codon:yes stop_codon:yes gene_type:complete